MSQEVLDQSAQRYTTATTSQSLVFGATPAKSMIQAFKNVSKKALPITFQTEIAQWVAFPLETSINPFNFGSSLSHIDGPYAVGSSLSSAESDRPSDFIMTQGGLPALDRKAGISLSRRNVPGFNGTYLKSGIGPSVVIALSAMGYNIKGFPARPPLKGELVTDEDQKLYRYGSNSTYLHYFRVPWLFSMSALVCLHQALHFL
jgi:hypothetical protein